MRISSCLVLGNERCKIDLDGPKGKYGVVREKQNSCLNSLAGKKQTGRIAGARGMNSKGTSICTYLTLYFKVTFKYTRSVGEASDTPVRYLYRKYLRGVYCARKYLSLGSKAAPEKKSHCRQRSLTGEKAMVGAAVRIYHGYHTILL